MPNNSVHLIKSYADKWKQLIQTSIIAEKTILENYIKTAYELMGYEAPECIFVSDVKVAIIDILNHYECYHVQPDIKYRLGQEIWNNIKIQINYETRRHIVQGNRDLYQLAFEYKQQKFLNSFKEIIPYLTNNQKTLLVRIKINLLIEKWVTYGSQSDFCISELNCSFDVEKWKVFKLLTNQCGCIYCLTSLNQTNIKSKEIVIVEVVG
ncbi:MAG TPA: hypothetical protein V6D15_11620 [Oculatellaceae cyanobacterium]|jgi:hypothetical protein